MGEDRKKKYREAFATVLRKRRQAAGLSQEDLGFKAGITMRYVSVLENNKRQPTISTMIVICDALELSLTEFVAEMENLHAA